jgi:hypothetical protein
MSGTCRHGLLARGILAVPESGCHSPSTQNTNSILAANRRTDLSSNFQMCNSMMGKVDKTQRTRCSPLASHLGSVGDGRWLARLDIGVGHGVDTSTVRLAGASDLQAGGFQQLSTTTATYFGLSSGVRRGPEQPGRRHAMRQATAWNTPAHLEDVPSP